MANSLAPITLFTYKRLWHTQTTVAALQSNDLAPESDLIIFSEAPESEENDQDVQQVRAYLNTITGFKSVTIIERAHNLGLATSIISGVTEVLQRHDQIIVLEDDIVTSPYFLTYMNEALTLYAEDEQVISINGYVYPTLEPLPETFFVRGADCWGWATWRRGWQLFNPDGQELLRQLQQQQLCREFDFNHTYRFTHMLKDQIAGKNNSWAIRWYASAFLQQKLSLYPGHSLVYNTGNDGSGTHYSGSFSNLCADLSPAKIQLQRLPIEESTLARGVFERYLKSTHPSPRRLGQLMNFVAKKINTVIKTAR
jgi:hypothetical protein